MRHRKRKTSFWILLILLAFSALVAYACYQLRPLTESLTIARVDNTISRMLNLAIAEEIETGEIDYDRMVYLEKDTAGNITALKTNMAEINRLKTSILTTLDDQLYDISIDDISIPIGSLLFPDLSMGAVRSCPSALSPAVHPRRSSVICSQRPESIRHCTRSLWMSQ